MYHRKLEKPLPRVHPGTPQQRLGNAEIQRRKIIWIVRIEDRIIVGALLLDAGQVRRTVFRLAADSILKRRLVLNDVSRALGVDRSGILPFVAGPRLKEVDRRTYGVARGGLEVQLYVVLAFGRYDRILGHFDI